MPRSLVAEPRVGSRRSPATVWGAESDQLELDELLENPVPACTTEQLRSVGELALVLEIGVASEAEVTSVAVDGNDGRFQHDLAQVVVPPLRVALHLVSHVELDQAVSDQRAHRRLRSHFPLGRHEPSRLFRQIPQSIEDEVDLVARVFDVHAGERQVARHDPQVDQTIRTADGLMVALDGVAGAVGLRNEHAIRETHGTVLAQLLGASRRRSRTHCAGSFRPSSPPKN